MRSLAPILAGAAIGLVLVGTAAYLAMVYVDDVPRAPLR